MNKRKKATKTKPKKQIAYKGFFRGLVCNGIDYSFQYELRKLYTHKGKLELCSSGFHACKNPMEVFSYYPPGPNTEYAVVEQSGDMITEGDKTVSSKIKVLRKISLKELLLLAASFPKNSVTTIDFVNSVSTKHVSHSTTTGNSAYSATTGDYSHSVTTGDFSRSLTLGFRANSITEGWRAHSVTAGNDACAIATGKNSVAVALGIHSRVMTGEDGIIVLACYDLGQKGPRVLVGHVGENGIKANTLYEARDGEIREVRV